MVTLSLHGAKPVWWPLLNDTLLCKNNGIDLPARIISKPLHSSIPEYPSSILIQLPQRMSPEEQSDPKAYVVMRRRMSENYQMCDMNMDCLEMIFSYLDYVQLVRVSRTCKLWYNVADYVTKTQFKELDLRLVFEDWKMIFRLSDKHFANVFKRTNLSALDIGIPFGDIISKSARIMPHGLLKAVVEHCPNLEKLNARKIIWELKPALSLFAGLSNLTHLELLGSSLTDPILSSIFLNCKYLIYLDIGETLVTADCFKNVSPNVIKALNISADRNFPSRWRDVGGILEDVRKMCPNLEKLDVSEHAFGYFEDVFLLGSFKEDLPLDTLRYLNMSCMRDWDEDEDLPMPLAISVNSRMPNLEALDIRDSDILLSDKFLPKLQLYCPKLRSLDISDCYVSLFGLGNGWDCDLTQLLSLNKLHVFKLNSVKIANTYSDHAFSSNTLQSCVHHISHLLKQLKVLEMSGYPALDNGHVVELIINLTDLRELVIEDCTKVDNGIFSLLTAHPKFVERKQLLDLRVRGTGITLSKVTVPNYIKLFFTRHCYGHGISKDMIGFD